jgi:hypothetical protein
VVFSFHVPCASAYLPSRSNISKSPAPVRLSAMLCALRILTVLMTVRVKSIASNSAWASHAVARPMYILRTVCPPHGQYGQLTDAAVSRVGVRRMSWLSRSSTYVISGNEKLQPCIPPRKVPFSPTRAHFEAWTVSHESVVLLGDGGQAYGGDTG